MLARENGAVMCPQGDLKVGPLTEYDYAGKPDGKIRPLIWERMVSHSIRPDVEDGFLLPYHRWPSITGRAAAGDLVPASRDLSASPAVGQRCRWTSSVRDTVRPAPENKRDVFDSRV